jgi:hypothetical protein
MHCQKSHMKNKIAIASSVGGLAALCVVYFGMHQAPLNHHTQIAWDLFVGGFALTFLAAVLAATSLPGHWRSGGIVGRFLWCLAVLAAYAGMLAYGS